MSSTNPLGRPASIPEWAYGEVFRLNEEGMGCRRIVRLLEGEGVFTTKSTVHRLLHQQPNKFLRCTIRPKRCSNPIPNDDAQYPDRAKREEGRHKDTEWNS